MNTQKLLDDMLSAALNIVETEGKQLGEPLQRAFSQQRQSLEPLITAKLTGEISEDEFEAELLREQEVLEIELITLEIISKATIQKAVNAAMDCLAEGVRL